MTALRYGISDTLVLAKRSLLRIPRQPDLLVGFTIQPVLFMLLFVYVFGGAIQTPGFDYVDFLMPGIIVQSIVFGGFVTALGLADDLKKGLMDRFRSLPMTRSALLTGRTLGDVVTNIFQLVVMFTVGLLVGFNFSSSVGEVVAGIALLLLIGYAFSWVFAFIGLSPRRRRRRTRTGSRSSSRSRSSRRRSSRSTSMPSWLQPIAEHNPFTSMVDAARALFLGTPAGDDVWLALSGRSRSSRSSRHSRPGDTGASSRARQVAASAARPGRRASVPSASVTQTRPTLPLRSELAVEPSLLNTLLENLGRDVIQVVAAPARPRRARRRSRDLRLGGALCAGAGAVVLAVGVRLGTPDCGTMLGRLRQARRRGCGGESPDGAVAELSRDAASVGVALLSVPDEMTWTQLHGFLVNASRFSAQATGGGGIAGVPLGDLFALANAIADIVGGAVTIEDPGDACSPTRRSTTSRSTRPGAARSSAVRSPTHRGCGPSTAACSRAPVC